MLTEGDLVKIPQGAILSGLLDDSWRLNVMRDPSFAVVLKNKGEKCSVLYEGQSWVVKSSDLQLVGSQNVRKAT